MLGSGALECSVVGVMDSWGLEGQKDGFVLFVL